MLGVPEDDEHLAISAFVFEHGCDVVEHQQFDDTVRGTLFLRTSFRSTQQTDRAALSAAFAPVAHYVTPELDEGPIIEQQVIPIDHTFDPRALTTVSRDARHWPCPGRSAGTVSAACCSTTGARSCSAGPGGPHDRGYLSAEGGTSLPPTLDRAIMSWHRSQWIGHET